MKNQDKSQEVEMRLIKVQGKGHIAIEPDMVTLSFDIEAKVRDYEKCLHELNMRADDLRQSMIDSGLDKAQLKTSNFNVQIDTQYENGKRIFVGYSASHRMSIELPMDKQLLNKVLYHVAKGHSGTEIDLSFSIRDKEALRKRVLTQAVHVAKQNAETLASAAGIKLGKLVEMDYGWSEVHIYNRRASMICESPSTTMFNCPDIEPEDVTAEDNVTLVYEILE